MPSAKHNLPMDKATGLIFSLFNITLSRDVPFHQPQDVHCMHHEFTFVLLCVPVLFADNARCQYVIARYGFPQADLRQCMLSAQNFLYWVYYLFLYRVFTNYVKQSFYYIPRNCFLEQSKVHCYWSCHWLSFWNYYLNS